MTFAQKPGVILIMNDFDSAASLSLHAEATYAALGPAMGRFNNLAMFDVPRLQLHCTGSPDRVLAGVVRNRRLARGRHKPCVGMEGRPLKPAPFVCYRPAMRSICAAATGYSGGVAAVRTLLTELPGARGRVRR